MSLRYAELAQVVEELGALAGGFVQKVHAPQPRLAFLEVRQVGRSTLLCLSTQPELARLSVAPERPVSPPEALPFQRALRNALIGARLTGLTLAPDDRIIRLTFEHSAGPRTLVADLRAPAGNLVLLGAGERILGVAEPAAGLRAGLLYAPPPAELTAAARALPSRLSVEGTEKVEAFPLAAAAEALYAERDRSKRADEVRRRLLGPLKAKVARAARTIEKVRVESQRQDAAEEHRRTGELLSQNQHRLQRGVTAVMLTEYTGEGPREVEVTLDPRRSPKEEVEWRFRQYRRLLRGSEAAAARLVMLEEELRALQARLAALTSATEEALLAREEEAPAAGRGGGGGGEPQVAKPFKEYVSARGERILVGKGSDANDTLTFKIARPQDLWLHARGVPGSHVVVPQERGADLPQELLLDAAHLALHHSSAKGEPRGEVSYTQVKFVNHQKGGAPGQVTYTREKTFLVRIEPDRLERLLKTRDGG